MEAKEYGLCAHSVTAVWLYCMVANIFFVDVAATSHIPVSRKAEKIAL
jgi:hypothetical protein